VNVQKIALEEKIFQHKQLADTFLFIQAKKLFEDTMLTKILHQKQTPPTNAFNWVLR